MRVKRYLLGAIIGISVAALTGQSRAVVTMDVVTSDDGSPL